MDFTLSQEQQQLRTTVRALATEHFAPTAYTWEGSGRYPFENLRLLAGHGLTGMALPDGLGGQNASLVDTVLVMEEIGQVCPHTADAFHVSNFGAIRQIAEFANDDMKQRVLPALLSGEEIVSIGMSEPEAGSAVNELRTTARFDGDRVIINGQKIFNSEAPHATWWVVWVRFGADPKSIGAVLVHRDDPGFSLGRTAQFMPGVQHSTLHFEDCIVPRANVLLEGDGLRRMLTIFNIERLGNAARSLALGQAAFDLARDHAMTREQFGQRLADFQGIRWKFADMKLKLEAARLLIYQAAANADANGGRPSRQETAIAKCFANVAGFEVANEALQIFGASGYDMESHVNYLFRRTRGWMIAGGTVEVMKNDIAKGVFPKTR